VIKMGPSGPKAFFLALAWARRIPNGPWRVSASSARAGVSLLISFPPPDGFRDKSRHFLTKVCAVADYR
jgi:hypothetical protein